MAGTIGNIQIAIADIDPVKLTKFLDYVTYSAALMGLECVAHAYMTPEEDEINSIEEESRIAETKKAHNSHVSAKGNPGSRITASSQNEIEQR
jgi:hypothetical protein